jgi:hypothetical protein
MFSLKLRARCSSVTSAVKKDRELGIEDENEKEHEDERRTSLASVTSCEEGFSTRRETFFVFCVFFGQPIC